MHIKRNGQSILSQWRTVIMIIMEKPRQTTLVQIFGSMSNKKNPHEAAEQAIEPKKDEIFQSAQESPLNISYPLKTSKKQSKLLTFLASITPEFKQQLADFLISHKEQYNNRQPKNICLYEDVLFIFGYKTSEDKIRTSKKTQIDELTKELEEATNKKAITIKERVEKKLANLTIDEIRSFMQTNTDISFNDKKQLNNKPKNGYICSKGSLPSNEQPQPQQQKSRERLEEVAETKKINQSTAEKARNFERSKISGQDTSKTSLFNRSVYAYGTKPVRENIKFFYNPISKTLIPFKKSQIESFKEAEQRDSQSQSPQSIQEENRMMTEISMNSAEKSGKQIKVERDVVELMDSHLHKEKMINEPEDYRNYIEKIRLQTLKTLEELQNGEKNEQNQKAIAQLQQKITEISRLLNEVNFQKQPQKQQSPQTSMHPQRNYSEEEDSRYIQSKSGSKQLPTTGKKSLPGDEQPSMKDKPNLVINMSPSEAANQLKRLMQMLSGNESYFEIIKNDPSKLMIYAWNEEQDKILWSFKFSPKMYRSQMLCLLRYKTMSMIQERIKFLKIDVDQKLANELSELASEEARSRNNDSHRMSFRGEGMQIEVNDGQ